MVYMLPGSNYKEADLHQIHEDAVKEADVALLADAWEVSSCIAPPPFPFQLPLPPLLSCGQGTHDVQQHAAPVCPQQQMTTAVWQLE